MKTEIKCFAAGVGITLFAEAAAIGGIAGYKALCNLPPMIPANAVIYWDTNLDGQRTGKVYIGPEEEPPDEGQPKGKLKK